jgi:hypothetical protein
MNKKDYIKPSMEVVALKQKCQILAGSTDAYGMKNKLVNDEEVEEGW